MWECINCKEQVDDDWDTCWNCESARSAASDLSKKRLPSEIASRSEIRGDLSKSRTSGDNFALLIFVVLTICFSMVAGNLDYQAYVGFATQSRLKARGDQTDGSFSKMECSKYLKSGLIICSVDYTFIVKGNSYSGSGRTLGRPGVIIYDTADPHWNAVSNESYDNLYLYTFLGIGATLCAAVFIILWSCFVILYIRKFLRSVNKARRSARG